MQLTVSFLGSAERPDCACVVCSWFLVMGYGIFLTEPEFFIRRLRFWFSCRSEREDSCYRKYVITESGIFWKASFHTERISLCLVSDLFSLCCGGVCREEKHGFFDGFGYFV